MTTPAERLAAAIHMESAAIAPQTSPLIEAANEVLVVENGRFRSALEWIERQQFADRDTVTPETAWDAFQKQNRAVCAIYAKATDALHQQLSVNLEEGK